MDGNFLKLVEFSNGTFKNDTDIVPLMQLIEEDFELTELVDVIPKILSRSDSVQLLSCLFLGLTHKPISQKKRSKVIEKIVSELDIDNGSRQTSPNILNMILSEISKLNMSFLVQLSNICIDVIRDPERSSKTSWQEVIPKILGIVQEKKDVPYAGSEVSGSEFKDEIIRTICRINTNSNVIVPLASLFKKISMSNDQHEEVVNKLCDMFYVIEIRNLPSLMKDLLHLCKEDQIVVVFLKLRLFFEKKMHSNAIADEDMNSAVRKEIDDAQLTILTQTEEFATTSRLNDLIKLCKNSFNASCLLLDPFLFAVLLILSCIPAYQTQISDVLRTLITQAVNEEEKKRESAWLCHIIDSNFDIDQLFSKIIQSRLCENDKVMEGLVNLSFMLLAVCGIRSKESCLKKTWRIGRIVLVSLIKKYRKISKTVLQNLTDRIITGCISQQYTDCLLHLCNVASVTMVDNIPIIVRILEFLNSMPGIVSLRIVTALIPLTQVSSSLRDNIIMYLRKALFSRNPEIRQAAVLGFLQLLKFLKLQRTSTFSQNTLTQTMYNGPSIFTQICMDVHTQQTSSQQVHLSSNPNINEAICLEVVGILKRCFNQQASVKTTLYKGLFGAIYANPQLCSLVLDMLLSHFSQFYEDDFDILPPLKFKEAIIVRNNEVSLQEPLGHLIMLVQDVLGRPGLISAALADSDSEATRSIFKFTEIFDSMVDRFYKCELHHFHLNENSNFWDRSCDSMKTREIIQQILTVYEALIAYVTNTWNHNATIKHGRKLIALFNAYSQIIDFVSNTDGLTKKKDKNLVKDASKNGNTTVVSIKKKKTSKKDKNFAPKKCSFEIPPTTLNLKTINRLLSLFLLDDIEWSSVVAVQEVKSKNRLFTYSMNCALDATRQLQKRLNGEQRSSAVFNEVVSLAKLVFCRCLSRYDQIAEFDFTAAIISVECFSEIISLIVIHYKSKFSQFLQESIKTSPEDGLPRQLLPVLKVYKNLLNTILISNEEGNNDTINTDREDSLNRILAPTLINAVSTVVLALPSDHDVTKKILEWLVSIVEKYTFKNVNNCKTFMHLVFTMLNRCRADLTVMDSLCLQLCHLFPSINDTSHEATMRPLKMITNEFKTHILPMTCAALMSHLDDVDYMISRFKSENCIINYLQNDEDNPLTQYSVLQRREKEMCQQVTHITLIAENLIAIAAPTGPCLEFEIKFLIKTFTVLTALTKYFMSRSTATDPVYLNAQFHKLIKIAGSQFIRQAASELILYVEKDYENGNKKSLTHLNNQSKKQLVLLPKLVSELESFPKAVMHLSKKCKDTSLLNSVKLTITRDFRLNVKKVDELISKQNESNTSDTDEDVEEVIESPLLSPSKLNSQPSQKRRKT